MTKIAVVLSGCGVFDGAEIHESVDPEMVGERQPHGFYRQYIETFYGEERATRDCGACHY